MVGRCSAHVKPIADSIGQRKLGSGQVVKNITDNKVYAGISELSYSASLSHTSTFASLRPGPAVR